MKKVRLIIDSNCNLSKDVFDSEDIGFIPSLVVHDNKVFRDTVDITSEDIYEMCDKSSELPKTTALNTYKFEEYFKEFLKDSEKIIFISISLGLSCANANAHMAVENLNAQDRILILDSENLSCGIAILAERILKDIKEEMTFEQIKEDIDKIKKHVIVEFVIDRLDNLYKGGRCSSLSYFFGKKLHIHPIIGLKDGKMDAIHKIRSKDTLQGINKIIEDFKTDVDNDNVDFSSPVYITDAKDEEGSEYTLKELQKFCPKNAVLRISRASSVIAVHCGKKTLGIGWIKKQI